MTSRLHARPRNVLLRTSAAANCVEFYIVDRAQTARPDSYIDRVELIDGKAGLIDDYTLL